MKKTYVVKEESFLSKQWKKQHARKKEQQAAEAAERRPAYLRKETAGYLLLALLLFAIVASVNTLTNGCIVGALLLMPAVVAQVAERHKWAYSLYMLVLAGFLIGLLVGGQTAWLVLSIICAVLGAITLLAIHFMGLDED